jgi:hydrogenase maturation protease
LGLGNTLCGDDGIGPALIEELSRHSEQWAGKVELVDGGTQGLALLGLVAGRRAALILDAVAWGGDPGTIHVLRRPTLAANRAGSAHEGNAGELLAAAALLGDLPEQLVILGIQQQNIATGTGLSEAVRGAIQPALERARAVIEELLA